MAQIGTFTRAEDGSYSGTIKTLSLNIKARFLPAEPSENEKAPNLRVMAGNVDPRPRKAAPSCAPRAGLPRAPPAACGRAASALGSGPS